MHRPDPYEAATYAQQYPQYQLQRQMDLVDMLLENRIVFLPGPITEARAMDVIMRLLYLQSVKRDQDINLYINSPGGLVDQTLAIYDTIQFLGSGVATYCIGQAASGAAIILAAGAKGKRFALPNAKVMLHQPYGGVTGQAEDVRIQAEEVIKDKRRLNEILARHTGQPIERIEQETERDRYMTAEEALAYGLVDEILSDDDKPAPKKKG